MLNTLFHGDCFDLLPTIPGGSVDFLFIDPPYFKIKGDFDFQLSRDEWLSMHDRLAQESRRILKDNGSLILWGHARNIAYQQIIFDKYFSLLNSCVWEKKDAQTKKNCNEEQRRFIPITERFLFYDKGNDKSGLTMIFSTPELFGPIKAYMRGEKEKIKNDYGFTTEAQFNDFINQATNTKSIVSRHYFADSQYYFPTEEIYKKLQGIENVKYFKKEYQSFKKEYENLRAEYETLRAECETKRRYFSLTDRLKYDVIRWNQEVGKIKDLNHPTCKPPCLVKELIYICCRKGGLVVEPFAGTATTRCSCHDLGMEYMGAEINRQYWANQEERYTRHAQQQLLEFPE